MKKPLDKIEYRVVTSHADDWSHCSYMPCTSLKHARKTNKIMDGKFILKVSTTYKIVN